MAGTLAGVRVGVTGARKGTELCAALERRGAVALHGPTIDPDQPAPDDELLPQVRELLDAPPDWFVANTGTGVRLLAAVADRHGLGDRLRSLLGDEGVGVVARGAKAVGGLRALGLRADHVTDDETDAAVAAWLATRLRQGERLAVQYSARTRGDYTHLRDAHDVALQVLRPYRSGVPHDDAAACALVDATVAGDLDVVVVTSAIAVDNLVAIAERHGRRDPLLAALRDGVVAAAIGQVTADALRAHDVEPGIVPPRHRTGSLLTALEQWHATGRD